MAEKDRQSLVCVGQGSFRHGEEELHALFLGRTAGRFTWAVASAHDATAMAAAMAANAVFPISMPLMLVIPFISVFP